jgi:hypothetical protein
VTPTRLEIASASCRFPLVFAYILPYASQQLTLQEIVGPMALDLEFTFKNILVSSTMEPMSFPPNVLLNAIEPNPFGGRGSSGRGSEILITTSTEGDVCGTPPSNG